MDDPKHETEKCIEDPESKSRPNLVKVKQQDNWLKVVLLLLNGLLLCISITVVVLWRLNASPEKNGLDGSVSLTDSLCLPCSDIALHEDDIIENSVQFKRKKQDGGTWVCCAEGGRYLDRLVEKFVEKKYREDKSKRFCAADHSGSMKQKPAARVFGIAQPRSTSTDKTVRWGSLSFKHDSINYTNNSTFRVPHPGYYYVYTQVTLKEDTNNSEDLSIADAMIYHLVFRHNSESYGPDDKLLENFESRCKLQTKQSKTTSYVGAVFSLNKNDEIYVKVSHPERISQSPHGNYFGFHLI